MTTTNITDICSYLNSANNNTLIWNYTENPDLYNKHTQFVEKIDINTEYDASKNKNEVLKEIKLEPEIKPESPKEIVRESLFSLLKEEKKIKSKAVKNVIITPLELIVKECNSHPISNDYIKERIINLISQKEYVKVFGPKKSADTMSAFVNNKWNKSMVLFISFLFDKKIIYNKNEIIYNKNEGTIII